MTTFDIAPSANRLLIPRKFRLVFMRAREPLLTCVLLLQIFILFVLPTARATGWQPPHAAIYGILLTFVLLIALLSRSSWAVGAILLSLSVNIFGIIGRDMYSDQLTENINFLGQLFTELSLFWIVLTAVFSPGRITMHRIVGAIVLYLCIGMIFANMDIFLARTMPGAFTNLPADRFSLREVMNYFSLGALTTCNFGDIVPVHPIARALANVEAIIGQLFAPMFIARVINQYEGWKERKKAVQKNNGLP